MPANPVREKRDLLYIFGLPNPSELLVRVAITGEIQVIALGPEPLDRTTVLLQSPDGSVFSTRTYNLLEFAPIEWWRNSTTLLRAVENGWLYVDVATVVPVAPATIIEPDCCDLAVLKPDDAVIGDLLVYDGTNWVRLPTSASAGYVLASQGTGFVPAYQAASGGMAIGATVTSGTPGSILFVGPGPMLSQDNANFFWDDSTNQLGIGTTGPNERLTVEGRLSLRETTAPSAVANYGKVYVKGTTGLPYFMDDAGSEYDLTMVIGGTITSATSGSVLFAGALGVLSQDNANFFWDDAANQLKAANVYVSSDGTALLPSLTLGTTADPNTGFWHPAADTLAASTNGVEHWRISSAGMTTVTADAGTVAFEAFVVGSGFGARFDPANSNYGFGISGAPGHTMDIQSSANPTTLNLQNNDSGELTRIRLNGGGHQAQISVNTPTSSSGTFPNEIFGWSMGSAAANTYGLGIFNRGQGGTTSFPAVISFATGNPGSGNPPTERFHIGEDNDSTIGGNIFNLPLADFDFRVNGTSANLIFGDASTNRLGIGTATPSAKLDVDNGATAVSIFVARDNGSEVFSILDGGALQVAEIAAPATPASGFGRVYEKTDGLLYFKNDAGTEYDLTATGAGMAIGGAITGATAGSVLFAGAAGVLAQDNANLFWDDTNDRLGIGNNVPVFKTHVSVTESGAVTTAISAVDQYNGTEASLGPVLRLRRARGTFATPAVIGATDIIGTLDFASWDSAAFISAARMQVRHSGGTPTAGEMNGEMNFLLGTFGGVLGSVLEIIKGGTSSLSTRFNGAGADAHSFTVVARGNANALNLSGTGAVAGFARLGINRVPVTDASGGTPVLDIAYNDNVGASIQLTNTTSINQSGTQYVMRGPSSTVTTLGMFQAGHATAVVDGRAILNTNATNGFLLGATGTVKAVLFSYNLSTITHSISNTDVRFGVDGTAALPAVTLGATSDTDTGWWHPAANTMAWSTAGVERARITAAGLFGVGTTIPVRRIHVTGGVNAERGIMTAQHSTDTTSSIWNFRKSRGTESVPTTVVSGDYVAFHGYEAYDGTSYLFSAGIASRATGTIATGSVPQEITLYIAPAGSGAPFGTTAERLTVRDTEVVVNEFGNALTDFRVEGDTNANLLVVDASADSVGIGTATPLSGLDVQTSQGLKRTTVADTNYTVLDTDYLVAYTSITAARTVNLPTASGRAGRIVWVKDESGAASVTNTITIDPSGAETIDGAGTIVIITAYGRAAIYSDGTNWFTLMMAL